MNFVHYITKRLKERSTWLGIISIVIALGINLTPELTEAIISTGIAVAGFVAVVTKDNE